MLSAAHAAVPCPGLCAYTGDALASPKTPANAVAAKRIDIRMVCSYRDRFYSVRLPFDFAQGTPSTGRGVKPDPTYVPDSRSWSGWTTLGGGHHMRESAGLLLFRRHGGRLEVLLVHPGGPFWASKDDGAWTIPKGELTGEEDPLAAAKREFEEETGAAPSGPLIALTPLRQPGGKLVHAWAVEGFFDPASLRSNSFQMEWPPRSGRQQEFPEVDRAEWFDLMGARRKIVRGQAPFLNELERLSAQGIV